MGATNNPSDSLTRDTCLGQYEVIARDAEAGVCSELELDALAHLGDRLLHLGRRDGFRDDFVRKRDILEDRGHARFRPVGAGRI